MATRLYFSGATAAPVSPAFDAGWNYNTEAVRRLLLKSKSAGESLAAGTQIGPWTATAGQTALDRQFVSYPLAAQTISGTFKGQVMVRELANTDNVDQLYVAVKVVSNDGNTVRATLFALANATTTVEFINNATCRNKRIADGDSLSSYACVDGDRLLVEIGYRNSTAATTPEALAKWGAPSGTGDLAENETDTTDGVGWIEFSATIAWQTVTGTGALTARAPTVAAAGKLVAKGTAALAAKAPTLSSAGKAIAKGTAALVTRPPMMTGSGTVGGDAVTGSGALTARPPTIAATGKLVVKGSGALVGKAPSLAATGKAIARGTAALVARPPAMTGSGAVGGDAVAGSGTLAARPPTIAAAGKLVSKGAGALVAKAPAMAATGKAIAKGAGTLASMAPSLSAAGSVSSVGVVGEVGLLAVEWVPAQRVVEMLAESRVEWPFARSRVVEFVERVSYGT